MELLKEQKCSDLTVNLFSKSSFVSLEVRVVSGIRPLGKDGLVPEANMKGDYVQSVFLPENVH